jgi:LysM repeat protein
LILSLRPHKTVLSFLPLELPGKGSYFRGMRRISAFSALCILCTATWVGAQDATPSAAPAPSPAPAATPAPPDVSSQELQEDYKTLEGKVQDMIDAASAQDKRIQDLEKEVSELRDQISAKPTGDFVSQDDFKKALEEIDKQRQADKDVILKALKGISPAAKIAPTRTHTPAPKPENSDVTPGPKGDEDVYTYEIKAGDTLSVIRQAYKEQGIKVSIQQILDANPGLDPTKLRIGQKISIPVPKGSAPKAN